MPAKFWKLDRVLFFNYNCKLFYIGTTSGHYIFVCGDTTVFGSYTSAESRISTAYLTAIESCQQLLNTSLAEFARLGYITDTDSQQILSEEQCCIDQCSRILRQVAV